MDILITNNIAIVDVFFSLMKILFLGFASCFCLFVCLGLILEVLARKILFHACAGLLCMLWEETSTDKPPALIFSRTDRQ